MKPVQDSVRRYAMVLDTYRFRAQYLFSALPSPMWRGIMQQRKCITVIRHGNNLLYSPQFHAFLLISFMFSLFKRILSNWFIRFCRILSLVLITTGRLALDDVSISCNGPFFWATRNYVLRNLYLLAFSYERMLPGSTEPPTQLSNTTLTIITNKGK
jgi:hypothetical protein